MSTRLLVLNLLLAAACMSNDQNGSSGQPQAGPPGGADRYAGERSRMVSEQIQARGVRSAAVLDAMRRVPRHRFVPAPLEAEAYDDRPLPIGSGQTISQPYIVAYMTEALELSPGHKVLEIGTGSGYQAAVLSALVRDVYTIEIVEELASRAAQTLREIGCTNVHVRHGDGYAGWPEEAPFDAIMVTAAPDHVPEPLVRQLAPGGRMIIPVGRGEQELRLIRKTPNGVVERTTIAVRFVPLTRNKR